MKTNVVAEHLADAVAEVGRDHRALDRATAPRRRRAARRRRNHAGRRARARGTDRRPAGARRRGMIPARGPSSSSDRRRAVGTHERRRLDARAPGRRPRRARAGSAAPGPGPARCRRPRSSSPRRSAPGGRAASVAVEIRSGASGHRTDEVEEHAPDHERRHRARGVRRRGRGAPTEARRGRCPGSHGPWHSSVGTKSSPSTWKKGSRIAPTPETGRSRSTTGVRSRRRRRRG